MSDLGGTTVGPLWSRVFGKAAIALLIRLGSAGLSFGSMVLVSRWIGAEAYGAFAVMLTLGSFIGLAATLGMPTLALRTIPRIGVAQGSDAGRATRSFVRTSCLAVLWAGLLLSLMLMAAGVVFGHATLRYAACLVLPFAFSEHLAHILRAFGEIVSALLPRDVLWYGLTAVLGVSASGAFPGLPAVWLPSPEAAFMAVAALLLGLVAWQGCRALSVLKPPQDAPGRSREPYRIAWRSEALFLWLSSMAGAVQRHLSVVVAAPFLTPVETGAFFAAHRTALLLSLPLIAANLVVSPMIARAWAQRRPDQVQRLCKLIVLGAAAPACLGLGVIWIAGDWLLWLFDPAFTTGLDALYIFAFASLVNALCGPTGVVMLMTGHEKRFVEIQVATQIASLILTMLGASVWGLAGAAAGASAGTVGWNLLVWIWCRRQIGIDPTLFAWLSRRPREPHL